MKKLLLFYFIFFSGIAFSQPYTNNWIDYNKTYHKFKVGSTGLYRISQPALSAIGLGGTSAEHFQLWRNGEQVRLYTSSATGPLSSSGYIEFWGVMNDGRKDTRLYRNPDYQLSDHWSLQTDTATYFLTVNPSGGNLRFTNTPNNVAGNILPEEPYFMHTAGVYYKNRINAGFAIPVGFYVYSSSYDIGEGYTSTEINPGAGLTHQFDSLNLYPSGPAASFKFGAAGNAPNGRNIRVKLFENQIINEPMSNFSYIKREIKNIPLSYFTRPGLLSVNVQSSSTITTDRIVVSFLEIKYPSIFNFNTKKNFYFELPSSARGNYLVIDNFNYGNTAPVLLDLNSGNRYTGDISTTGKVKVVLPPSTDTLRRFILVSEEAGNVQQVNNFAQRNFVNYGNPQNQGDYIIITNATLFNNGAGINYVEQYGAYRSSVAGGSFNTKILDIDQLTDQFAFGIKKHPLAIKDFVRYAVNNFADTPKHLFIIGRGVTYNEYRVNESDPLAEKLNLVPTFGNPASDVLLASDYNSIVPDIPIGRLSVVNGNELANYLEKMKQYEAAQVSASQTLADKAWMKNVVHVTGGSDSSESALFNAYMNQYKRVIEDTLYGGKVETFSKSSNAAVQIIEVKRIADLFNEGISLLSYFGHSSASTLGYNLDNPETYNNQGKYPFFNVSGCTAGNNYVFDVVRLNGNLSLSERYVLADQRGSIAFLASTHLGIPPFLHNYNKELYRSIGITNYDNSAGFHIKTTIKNTGGASPALDYFTRLHLEEITLHGDPALKINPHPKPDYVIEEPAIRIEPAIISIADNSFDISIKMTNIGKAINDSVRVTVKRTLPDNSLLILRDTMIPAIKYQDSLNISTTINPLTDAGLNKITVTIDEDNRVEEILESNNTVTRQFFIFEDVIRPVYPYNYSIINKQNIAYYGSTANALSAEQQIMLEIDTSGLFNSPFKKVFNATARGGLVQFSPVITYQNNIVYYWRLAKAVTSGDIIWNNASFLYAANGSPGFNQSHYYQHLNSNYNVITLNNNRNYAYTPVTHELQIESTTYPTGSAFDSDFRLTVDGNSSDWVAACGYGIIFNVFDTVDLKPLFNNSAGQPGRLGSYSVCAANRTYNFEYNFNTVSGRKAAMDFMDSIPAGSYVVVRMFQSPNVTENVYAEGWKNDQSIYGAGNSLYHKLFNAGLQDIDSFYRPRTFNFVYRKNDNRFSPVSSFSSGIFDRIINTINLQTTASFGTIESPLFGVAKQWKSLQWNGKDLEPQNPDDVSIEVYGVTRTGVAAKVATIRQAKDTTLSFINAATYPYIRLKMLNRDVVRGTPYQLNFWRVNADYVPEGAVAPGILFTMKDTVEAGEQIEFELVFKNISEIAFDSLKVKVIITDKNNVAHQVILPRKKPLITGDTLIVKYTIDSKDYAGMNTLFVEVNPDNDQPEQYQFNNFIYYNFFVKGDTFNPLLDVTFDGLHILNRDIVSAKPHIVIKLKDESKFLALNDTSLLNVQIRYPDGTLRTYKFDNDTVRFTPANLGSGENTATIDFTPSLPGDDEEYELIVSGKDASGNTAGKMQYRVSFRIISKPMISNLLNYPNPFTTSTAFVFTVTGSQVPQNIRIQILTITGKIVREITKNELGPLHIGRNITEFKWDGTDMYGQKLGNGVYLYRVLTNLNGRSLEKYKAEGDDTDKYFTKGYGKMYLMR